MIRDFEFGDVVEVAVRRKGHFGYSPAVFFERIRGVMVAVHPILINRTPLPIHLTDEDRTILSTNPLVLPSRFLKKMGQRWGLDTILERLDQFAILTEHGRPISGDERERIRRLSSLVE